MARTRQSGGHWRREPSADLAEHVQRLRTATSGITRVGDWNRICTQNDHTVSIIRMPRSWAFANTSFSA